jgi:hypothetical protein
VGNNTSPNSGDIPYPLLHKSQAAPCVTAAHFFWPAVDKQYDMGLVLMKEEENTIESKYH